MKINRLGLSCGSKIGLTLLVVYLSSEPVFGIDGFYRFLAFLWISFLLKSQIRLEKF